MTSAIDWGLALSTGLRTAPRGPETTLTEAADMVALLRASAEEAVPHVRRTALMDAGDAPPAIVVDRPTWIESNLAGFRVALAPALEKIEAEVSGLPREVGARLTAVEMGAVLGWLSGKVLGQYEAFRPPGEPGRLLLVAPNIVSAQRAMGADPRDFALWVALHEETHRVQFGAVPWLGDYMTEQVHAFIEASDASPLELAKRLGAVLGSVSRGVRGQPGRSLMEAVQSPAQQEIFDRLTAMMTLLEGHADVVMDEVGPEVVPTVATIRERFEARRASHGSFDGLLRRFLGLDAKMRQYADGARFVRGVTDRVGTEGFNAVWQSPDTLPTREEIADPAAWVRRVHLRGPQSDIHGGAPALDGGVPGGEPR